MSNPQELLELAARFREFALQTSLDNYAVQMLRTATELEAYAGLQLDAQPAQNKRRTA